MARLLITRDFGGDLCTEWVIRPDDVVKDKHFVRQSDGTLWTNGGEGFAHPRLVSRHSYEDAGEKFGVLLAEGEWAIINWRFKIDRL